jgi:TolA-binding protein
MKKENKNNKAGKTEPYFEIKDEDALLFDSISEVLKGRFDYEAVINDPDLHLAEKSAEEWLNEYNMNDQINSDVRKFLKEVIAETDKEKQIEAEINAIESEINRSNINQISETWIDEWNETKKTGSDSDSRISEIENFITSALETEPDKKNYSLTDIGEIKKNRSYRIRYISLSAAAFIGILIFLRVLLPSSDTNKLYRQFYKPFDAISEITRNPGKNSVDSYQTAISNYKKGDYRLALKGFTEAFDKDTTLFSSRFYAGISFLATENYMQAVKFLNLISETGGEYQKDALWYLGLTYLKTGEKEKAAGCFAQLVNSSEYYKERAEKILRRLRK